MDQTLAGPIPTVRFDGERARQESAIGDSLFCRDRGTVYTVIRPGKSARDKFGKGEPVGDFAVQYRIRRRWPTGLLAAFLVLCVGFASSASAADGEENSSATSLFGSKYTVFLGGFFPHVDATFSLNPSRGGSGKDVSFEDDLGMDKSTSSVWVGFTWRFKPRHQFQAEWFQLNRSGETSAGREFPVGDTTVFAGASLSSKMDLNLGRLTYGYSIIRDDKFDLSFLVGAHVATTKVTVSAAGAISVDGVPKLGGSSTESSSTITFPLPHLGGQFSYKFSPKWTAQLTVLAFALDVNDYSGSLLEVDGTVGYQLSKRFGIGTGLKYFNLNLQAQKSRGGAEFNYQFFGPAVFGYATF